MSGDRFAAMAWPHDGPCPTCGQRPGGPPVYRPEHAKAVSDEARRRYEAFAAKPEGRPK